ncbi:MAG TPA: hypothetical protein VNK91_06505 [Burkholderiaceae bacterium]|nr:hypothetical protein [Burkholderiaceae bacterium]
MAKLTAKKLAAVAAPAPDPGATARIVRQVTSAFVGRLPAAARSGHYRVEPGDQFDGSYAVPDGHYRVVGADWIVAFRDGRFVEAYRALPPDYGGAAVIAVAADG